MYSQVYKRLNWYGINLVVLYKFSEIQINKANYINYNLISFNFLIILIHF